MSSNINTAPIMLNNPHRSNYDIVMKELKQGKGAFIGSGYIHVEGSYIYFTEQLDSLLRYKYTDEEMGFILGTRHNRKCSVCGCYGHTKINCKKATFIIDHYRRNFINEHGVKEKILWAGDAYVAMKHNIKSFTFFYFKFNHDWINKQVNKWAFEKGYKKLLEMPQNVERPRNSPY